MAEIWKDIKGYDGLYMVSSLGRILSVKSNLVLSLNTKKNGYVQTCLSKNGITSTFRVHRLVAIAFHDNPSNLSIVNHKNGVKNDNNAENLEWASDSENSVHAYKNNLRVSPKFWSDKVGSDHNRSVKIEMINPDGSKTIFGSMHEAHRKTGVQSANIFKCCKGERKTAGGLKWRYVK